MRKSFFMVSAALGAMTAAEQAKGRYMRAPDGHDAFAEFEKAGEVEVGSSQVDGDDKPAKEAIESNTPKPAPKRAPKPAKEAPAAKAATEKAAGAEKPGEGDDDAPKEGEDGEDEDGEDEGEEEKAKPARKASDRIKELTARNRSQGRLIEQLSTRLDAIEKGGLPAAAPGGKSTGDTKAAPDPTDADKYPLGHLDDRYIEDKLEWLAEKKAATQADAVLQRQQETEQQREAQKAQEALLEKVDDLSTRGSEKYDDFQEAVVEAGMRGDWRLGQATFEAAHEAENGAQILYELSQDKKEAARVAALSPFGQAKFVLDRDLAIGAKAKPRTKPGAGEPPQTQTRGTNSRVQIDPTTDNLDDFEKAWKTGK